jgi:hypothetical protein
MVTATSSNPAVCFIINGEEILLQQNLHPSTYTDSISFFYHGIPHCMADYITAAQ